MTLMHYGQFENNLDPSIRSTENSDIRITEQNDIREISDQTNNAASSSIIANPTLFPFTYGVFVNQNLVWKTSEIYVNYLENWVVPSRIYKKEAGSWKRIY